jgi:secreted trypsin-like serine protease
MANNKNKLIFIFAFASLLPQAHAIVVGSGSPNDPIYLSSNTAVGFTNIPGPGRCSGSLLNTGMHFLTAAHCILGATGPATVSFSNGLQQFDYSSVSMVANPGFNSANYFGGNDIAIITLNQVVDSSIARLSLYSGSGEVGSVATVIGYGREGVGTSGGVGGSFGVRRQGQNTVDEIIGNNNILFFDFDNASNPGQSTLGSSTPVAREVGIMFGDSGGPTLINGRIAGVHSFLTCVSGTTTQCATGIDSTGSIDGSFGERWGDTRVSVYTQWITSITGALDPPVSGVPEPSTVLAGVLAAVTCLAKARKNRNGSSS